MTLCMNTNRQLWDLTEAELRAAHEKLDARALEFVTVESSVAARRSYGGTGPDQVRTAIEEAKKLIAHDS